LEILSEFPLFHFRLLTSLLSNTTYKYVIVHYKKTPFILIFIRAFANGKSSKELYAKKFESDWKVYENENYVKKYIDTTIVSNFENGKSPEQTILENVKEKLNKRADSISQIMKSLKMNLVLRQTAILCN
jgi:hypothetical protein